MSKIIIVIPAFNEEPRISKVIAGIPKAINIKKKIFNTQIVVVDDGSADHTFIAARKSGATVLRHIMNSGAGAATRTGLRYAESNSEGVDYVVTIDADGQHSSDDIKTLVDYAVKHGSSMVVGNRLH